ncbi:MAG: PL29 family lyase N-terminal domain-containing protein, partial [Candidatus Cryptobacteroides sp.]
QALETQIEVLNTNIATLQKLADGGIVSNVKKEGEVYTITLGDGSTIVLNQGSVGIGNAPVISIDDEGYWMVDYGDGADYIRVNEEKVKAVGTDGITPVFGVDNEGYWTVSYDGGNTFSQVKDANGNPVKAIPDGGVQDKWFDSVGVEGDKLVVVLKNGGGTYSLPIVKDFRCAILNAEDEILFNYNESKIFTVEMSGVASALVNAPEGWSAVLNETTLSITAPAGTKAVNADSRTDVCILAISNSGFASISKVKVRLSDVPIVVNPTASVTVETTEMYSITFKVSTADVTLWKYIFQASETTAPDAAQIAADGTVGTETTLTFNALTANTAYTLYVLPVNGEKNGAVASASSTTLPEDLDLDLYQDYCDGKDITLAGKVYNKETNGEAILVSADTENFLLNTIVKNNNGTGVFFLEDENNNCFSINAVTEIKGVVITSRYIDKPVTVKPLKFMKIVENGLVLANLDIDMTELINTANENNGYLLNNSASDDIDHLFIDNCRITHISKPVLATAGGSCSIAIKNIRIINSAFEVTGTTNIQLFNIYNCSVLSRMQEITFDNNILYSKELSVCQAFNWGNSTLQTENDWNTSVSFCNNTFYNTPSGYGHFKFYKVGNLECKNNIYWADPTHTQASAMFILYAEDQTGDNIEVSDNIAYGLADGKNWSMFHSNSKYQLESGNVLTKLETSPLQTADPTTGTFVPTSEYATYGAQR